jgi:flagellin-like hook-associated protein FlgL
MGQKTTTKVSCKVNNLYFTQGNQDQDFFQTITRVTDLKRLDQAIHNIDLGLELLDKADAAYEKIETILGQIKQLAAPRRASNLDASLHSSLNISLKKKELDLLYNTIQFKGKKILDGSLSASRNPEQHLYLMAGVMGSPKNRINLNIGLNIPKISSKTLGLGTTFFSTAKEEGFKIMIVLENAMSIIHRLKQRSLVLRDLLQKNKKSHDISIANHQSAESAPKSLTLAEEFLRTINKLDHKH